jgi:hypothetical protein
LLRPKSPLALLVLRSKALLPRLQDFAWISALAYAPVQSCHTARRTSQ